MTQRIPVLFVDSNVLIEAVLIPLSAAAVVSELVVNGTFDMARCALTVEDAERAFLKKIVSPADLDIVVQRWEELKSRIRLEIQRSLAGRGETGLRKIHRCHAPQS